MKKKIFYNTEGPFLTVWRLLKIGKLSICIHKFDQPDEDPDCHDHPFHFFTLVLKGWYLEEFEGGKWKFRHVLTGGFRKAKCLHRIEDCTSPVWTLCIKWEANRDWGFMTSKGWVQWEKYIKAKGLEPMSNSEEAF